MPRSESAPGRLFRMSLLLDAYGSLLTEKQRRFMDLHFEQDMSFGEIASMYDVSRQAIHDSVKHAERALEDYESKLRLVEQGFHFGERSDLVGKLIDLKQRIRQHGIIYNTEWIIRELSEAIESLVGEGGADVEEADAEMAGH